MATTCSDNDGGNILAGDAVCLTGWDSGNSRPEVKRATASSIVTSRTVFGVAAANTSTGSVPVLVAGEVARDAITGLGSTGGSRVVVIDIAEATAADQCRLKRIDTVGGSPAPTPEQYVVGTCNEDGDLAIQPRHNSDEVAFARVFNVREYGAMGDGTTYDDDAFEAAFNAIGIGKGGTLVVPEGVYRLSQTLHVTRGVVLRGLGGSARYGDAINGAVLLFDEGVDGIETLHGGQVEDASANGCVIEDLTIRADGHSVPGMRGIHMMTNTYINRCTVWGFSSHGIHIDATVLNSFPDNWQIQWSRATENGGDGLRVEGQDSNNGLALGFDAQANKGYGIFEASFLGSTYIACHTAENLLGGYAANVDGPGASQFLGCYSESDQPPNDFTGNNLTVLGGYDEAGLVSASNFFGGFAHNAKSTTWASTSNIRLVAAGTTPPRVTLKGVVSIPQADVRIEITTAGYPGGKDAYGNSAGPTAEFRWSIDAGVNWTGPIEMAPAWDPYNLGLSRVALGDSGLVAVFTPGEYATDNVYTASGGGGLQTFFRASSIDGTNTVCVWGHSSLSDPNRDAGYSLVWTPSRKQWDFVYGESRGFSGIHFTGATLPRPGKVVMDDGTWFGTATQGFTRIGAANGTFPIGTMNWLSSASVDMGLVGWFSAGDVLLNKSNDTPWPAAWRAREAGGWSASMAGVDNAWQAEFEYRPGESVRPSSPYDGYLYRALNIGTTDTTEPVTWPTTRGDTFSDGTVTWECVGPYGNVFEPILIQSEVLGTYTVTGSTALSLRESSYERLKLVDATADFDLELPSAEGADGWVRAIWNATAWTATIKGSSGDTGVNVPSGKAYQILSDGTECVRVE